LHKGKADELFPKQKGEDLMGEKIADGAVKLKACGCVQEFHKRLHCRETERIEELSPETEEKTQYLGDSEDNLPMRDIQEKFFPDPLSPLLTAF